MDRMTPTERLRFMDKIASDGECLVMATPLDRDGYASFYFRKKNRRAHRLSYWASVGDIPEGMVVDHSCNNRACVRPEHLRLLTPEQNSFRRRKDTCSQGHPFDREYGNQRYCSICDAAKKQRLKAKWRADGLDQVAGL